MTIDGLMHFGCSLERLPDQPLNADGLTLRRIMAKNGLDVPSLRAAPSGESVPAWIQQGMLVASCPPCAKKPEGQPHFVWRDGPYLLLCTNCGQVRTVEMPDNLAEVEAALACRPIGNQTWRPEQTVEDLLTQNRRFGWGPAEAT